MTKDTHSFKHTNALIHSSSPYLQQHAHNPVNWYPWGEEALKKARDEDKPILLSIGYSSCHWCHVMAHESFEDDSVANLMNEHFINIKLDREERPDIDQIYMDAVQAMGLRGGWPLNVFLFPDQKPFYGGTYFPKENWKQLLGAITQAYHNNRDKLYESALGFTAALNKQITNEQLTSSSKLPSLDQLSSSYEVLNKRFDGEWGGIKKSPKFPMPAVWNFVLEYQYLAKDQSALDHLQFTLDKMAMGGIYDQVGGGFSRYSVDAEWHVPHFEKMLYDNGQLLSLYANAYKVSKKKEYEVIMIETAQWLEREMMNENGGFYSALDADSDGEEGKYYVWSIEEIKEISGDHANIIIPYYDIKPEGNWETSNVLRRLHTDAEFCKIHQIEEEKLESVLKEFKKSALSLRETRIKPGLDSKIIAGWNGLALQGLLDAYQATGHLSFKELAQKNARFIVDNLLKDDTTLLRTSETDINAFLEDYSAVIQAFITYYETFFDEAYLDTANRLTEYTIEHFYDPEDSMFFFTSGKSETLIARKKEIYDNVIPASNSMMAQNMMQLGAILDRKDYQDKATAMYLKISDVMLSEPEYLANWGSGLLNINGQQAEVIVLGEETEAFIGEIQKEYFPDKVILGAIKGSKLPLFEYKTTQQGKTTIYVCFNKTCKKPVNDPVLAIQQLLH